MNFHASGFDHFSFDPPLAGPQPLQAPQLAQNALTAERIPPPASVATINGDAIDLNDEIFFHTAQNGASPVPPNSNYLVDLYHLDRGAFSVELSASDPPKTSPASFVYAGMSPVHPQHMGGSAAVLPEQLGRADGKNSALGPDLAAAAGDPRVHDPEPALDVKLALSTPDMAFAEPLLYNVHYLHQHRFSAAVEQMHKMSLQNSPQEHEEKTINPRQLLGYSAASSVLSLQNYMVQADDAYMQANTSPTAPAFPSALKNAQPQSSPSLKVTSGFPRYLLTLVLSPLLLTFFSEQIPDLVDRQGPDLASLALNNPLNPYVMNDECVSAITYWLNNTADVIQEKEKDAGIGLRHSRGVSKAWNRRNLIGVPVQEELKNSVQRRKRRKSDHIKESFAEVRFMPRAGEDFAVISETASSLSEYPAEPLEKEPDEEKAPETLSAVAEDDDGPKPFPCPDCEKQFKRLEHLKRHIRSVHSNIRPFHCKYCEKKFSRSDNLAQHLKTHFKLNANGTTSVIYGNPNPHNRGGRKQSVSEMEMH